jgi:hypothetical protein
MAALEAAVQETSWNFARIWLAGSSPAMTSFQLIATRFNRPSKAAGRTA